MARGRNDGFRWSHRRACATSARKSLILKDNLGQGLRFGVRDAERDVLHAELAGYFCGFTCEGHGRSAALLTHYFQIDPADSTPPSGAEGLHRSFLSGEAAGVAFELVF